MKTKSENKSLVSVKEYRHLLNDDKSTDERIKERLQYLESFCRNIIRAELEKLQEKSSVLQVTYKTDGLSQISWKEE